MVVNRDAGRELLARHDFRLWQTRIQLLSEKIESRLFDLVGRSSQLDRLGEARVLVNGRGKFIAVSGYRGCDGLSQRIRVWIVKRLQNFVACV
jgi:hypothetical protein